MKVLLAKRLDGDMSKMDITAAARETPLSAAPQEPGLPTALSLAMLSHTLRHPFRRPSEYATPTLNPYNTIILTFLATVLREPSARTPLWNGLGPTPGVGTLSISTSVLYVHVWATAAGRRRAGPIALEVS